jgi:hypothetical protein
MFSTFIDCSNMLSQKTTNDYNSMPGGASVSSGSSVSDSSQSTNSRKKKSKTPDKTKTALPLDFEPASYTVLCGRSRECYEWVGNRRFRTICNMYLQQYLDTQSKLEKSRIVTAVMKAIREGKKSGVFCTFENGRYYEVSQRTAREKVGGFFRDSLPAEYKSSAKAKLAKKRMETTTVAFPNGFPANFPLNEIFAPQQVASQQQHQQQQQQQLEPSLMDSLEKMETLEESPDFLTGGIFADEPFPMFQFGAISNINTSNNNYNNYYTAQEDEGKCDFLGATFFDVESV